VRKELRQHIAYLEGRITQIDDDIDKTVRRSEAWRRKREVLRSFPGVGKVFCTTVLSKLPELGHAQRQSRRRPGRNRPVPR